MNSNKNGGALSGQGIKAKQFPFAPSHHTVTYHCFSYSPLRTFLSTVKPAFFASEIESGLSLCGVLKDEMILRTGFLHAGHFSSGGADSGRFSVNLPPQTTQLPSH